MANPSSGDARFVVDGFQPAYLRLSRGELTARVEAALAELTACRACPRNCHVDRLHDRALVCRTGRHAVVASAFPHFGEEDCLRGWNGSGTTFFGFCNLRCVFCQNWDISQEEAGRERTAGEIADLALDLQAQGCHNLNFVTPEHVAPQVIEAIAAAVPEGLRLPIVYNTSAYDSLASLRLLDGLVDIYLPDFKFWSRESARRLAKAKDYPERAREAILEMHRQVGPLKFGRDGLAKRGVLVRHLVMPGQRDEAAAIFDWLARELSPDTYVNIMGQYRPDFKVGSVTDEGPSPLWRDRPQTGGCRDRRCVRDGTSRRAVAVRRAPAGAATVRTVTREQINRGTSMPGGGSGVMVNRYNYRAQIPVRGKSMSRTFAVLLTLACLAAITGCANRAASQLLTIRGSLAYRAATPPPPETRAIVELKDVSARDGRVLAEQRIDLQVGQAPVPFELVVERSKLADDEQYAVRAAFHLRGRPTWVSDPVFVTPQVGVVEVGMLAMKPYTALAFASDLKCGERKVTIGFVGDVMRLTAGDQWFEMRPVVSASGAKYEAVGDPSTTLWTKGSEARVVIKGVGYPICNAGAASAPFRATGNEPGWRLDIGEAEMTLVADYGKTRVVTSTPTPETAEGTRKYLAKSGGRDLTVTISDQLCTDSMTGMPHPSKVVVLFDGRTLSGCGGDPAVLLRGDWVVTEITGLRFADKARAAMTFGTDGKVAGDTPCGSFAAEYALTGESLTIGRISTTRLACDARIQKQRSAFLEALGRVNRFEVAPNGALLLHTSDQRTITARRG